MKKTILVPISLILAMTLSGIASAAVVDVNVKLDNVKFDGNAWVASTDFKKAISATISAVKGLKDAVFTTAAYDNANVQIRNDLYALSAYMKESKKQYKQLKTKSDKQALVNTLYADVVSYCQNGKALESAMWTAYNRNSKSTFPKDLPQPWMFFKSLNCDAYAKKTINAGLR